MTPADLDKLEKLARAAKSPSPWKCVDFDNLIDAKDMDILSWEVRDDGERNGCVENDQDARYIAAANPAAILELIKLARGGRGSSAGPKYTPIPAGPTCKNCGHRAGQHHPQGWACCLCDCEKIQ